MMRYSLLFFALVAVAFGQAAPLQPAIASIVSAAGSGGMGECLLFSQQGNCGLLVAPGSAATLFGTFPSLPSVSSPSGQALPTTLSGVSVLINGIPAPLYYVSARQINLQIPWELVEFQAGASPSFDWPTGYIPATVNVSASGAFGGWYATSQFPNDISFTGIAPTTAPAIYEADSATHRGAILDTQYALVSPSNPSSSGAALQIYCTGLGPVSVPQNDGSEAGTSPLAVADLTPQVLIGGIPATVLWAGLAPGTVGVYQVNVVVPKGIPSGNMTPVVMSVNMPVADDAFGDASELVYSNTVTLAISAPPSHLTLVSSPNPSIAGQPVAYTLTVSPSNAVGEVEFNFNGPNNTFGALSCQSAPGVAVVSGGYAVFLTNGQAICTSGTGPGINLVTASYTGAIGDPYCAAANPAISADSECSTTIVQIVKEATAVSLTSNINPSHAGQLVTFTAFLGNTNATGTMVFYDNTTLIGTVPVLAGDISTESRVQPSFATSSLSTGNHSITAVYSGDSVYGGSTSAAWTQIVD